MSWRDNNAYGRNSLCDLVRQGNILDLHAYLSLLRGDPTVKFSCPSVPSGTRIRIPSSSDAVLCELRHQDAESGWTALHRAVYEGDLEALLLLIQVEREEISLLEACAPRKQGSTSSSSSSATTTATAAQRSSSSTSKAAVVPKSASLCRDREQLTPVELLSVLLMPQLQHIRHHLHRGHEHSGGRNRSTSTSRFGCGVSPTGASRPFYTQLQQQRRWRGKLPAVGDDEECGTSCSSSIITSHASNRYTCEVYCAGDSEYALGSFASQSLKKSRQVQATPGVVTATDSAERSVGGGSGEKAVRFPVEKLAVTEAYNRRSSSGSRRGDGVSYGSSKEDTPPAALCFSDICTSSFHTMALMQSYSGGAAAGGGGDRSDSSDLVGDVRDFANRESIPALYSWGHGKDGRLGLGTTYDHTLVQIPTKVGQDIGVVAADCPSKKDDRGGGDGIPMSKKMHQFCTKVAVKQIALSDYHSLLLSTTGVVFSFGCNSHGQLGHGYVKEQVKVGGRRLKFAYEPIVIQSLTNFQRYASRSRSDKRRRHKCVLTDQEHGFVVTVAAGSQHSVCVDDMNRVFCWGSNEHGQCGTKYADKNEVDCVEANKKIASSSGNVRAGMARSNSTGSATNDNDSDDDEEYDESEEENNAAPTVDNSSEKKQGLSARSNTIPVGNVAKVVGAVGMRIIARPRAIDLISSLSAAATNVVKQCSVKQVVATSFTTVFLVSVPGASSVTTANSSGSAGNYYGSIDDSSTDNSHGVGQNVIVYECGHGVALPYKAVTLRKQYKLNNDIVQISGGKYFHQALLSDGRILQWDFSQNQVPSRNTPGNRSNDYVNSTPTKAPGSGKTAESVARGPSAACHSEGRFVATSANYDLEFHKCPLNVQSTSKSTHQSEADSEAAACGLAMGSFSTPSKKRSESLGVDEKDFDAPGSNEKAAKSTRSGSVSDAPTVRKARSSPYFVECRIAGEESGEYQGGTLPNKNKCMAGVQNRSLKASASVGGSNQLGGTVGSKIVSICSSHFRCAVVTEAGNVFTWEPAKRSLDELKTGLHISRSLESDSASLGEQQSGFNSADVATRTVTVTSVAGVKRAIKVAIADTHLFAVCALSLPVERPYDESFFTFSSSSFLPPANQLSAAEFEAILGEGEVNAENGDDFEYEDESRSNFGDLEVFDMDKIMSMVPANRVDYYNLEASMPKFCIGNITLRGLCERSIASSAFSASNHPTGHSETRLERAQVQCGAALITMSNVLSILNHARMHCAAELVKYCREFVLINLDIMLLHHSIADLVEVFVSPVIEVEEELEKDFALSLEEEQVDFVDSSGAEATAFNTAKTAADYRMKELRVMYPLLIHALSPPSGVDSLSCGDGRSSAAKTNSARVRNRKKRSESIDGGNGKAVNNETADLVDENSTNKSHSSKSSSSNSSNNNTSGASAGNSGEFCVKEGNPDTSVSEIMEENNYKHESSKPSRPSKGKAKFISLEAFEEKKKNQQRAVINASLSASAASWMKAPGGSVPASQLTTDPLPSPSSQSAAERELPTPVNSSSIFAPKHTSPLAGPPLESIRSTSGESATSVRRSESGSGGGRQQVKATGAQLSQKERKKMLQEQKSATLLSTNAPPSVPAVKNIWGAPPAEPVAAASASPFMHDSTSSSFARLQAEEEYVRNNSNMKQLSGNNPVASPWYVERTANMQNNLDNIMAIEEIQQENAAQRRLLEEAEKRRNLELLQEAQLRADRQSRKQAQRRRNTPGTTCDDPVAPSRTTNNGSANANSMRKSGKVNTTNKAGGVK